MKHGLLTAALILSSLLIPGVSAETPHTFTIANGQFQFDGRPYQILSGEMHYPRVPRAYWRDRFRKARAMGLNTITTYVFWNLHEPRPGVYDFSGDNDVAEYIREAQQEGLNVILRPGPYVCAEWDLGGYPSWLLKDRTLVLRSTDPKYLAVMNEWFARLAQEIRPLLLANGGPIIALQVENEYGSFGDDHAYMEAVKFALLKSGLAASGTLLYTADGADQIPKDRFRNFPPSSTSAPATQKQNSPNSRLSVPPAHSCQANTGPAGSITGASIITLPTPSLTRPSMSGCFTRATPSACTCFTVAPALAG